MHGVLVALLWLGFVLAAIVCVLVLVGLVYIGTLIKRQGFTELFRRLGTRRR